MLNEELIKKQNQVAEKVKVLQSELSSICSQIHEKSNEKVLLQNELDDIKKQIVIEEDKKRKIVFPIIDNYKEQISQLEFDIHKLQSDRGIVQDRFTEEKEESIKQSDSIVSSIRDLSYEKACIYMAVGKLQNQRDDLIKDTETLKQNLGIQRTKYGQEEELAHTILKNIEEDCDVVKKETVMLELRNRDLKKNWEALVIYQKYLDSENEKVSKKSELVEKVYNLLNKK